MMKHDGGDVGGAPQTPARAGPPAPPEPAPPPSAPATARASPEVAAFGAAIRTLTPRGFVTEALIAVNVLVFVIVIASGVHPMEPKVVDLLHWGAGYGPRTTNGEWWRLLTATFLHIGAIHLAMNMYVLWSAGRFVERLLGNAGFLVAYLGAGLAGSVASLLWSPYVVSAGASGAVFGVYGALLGFLARERDSIPREALQSLGRSAVLFLGYNLLFGLSVKGIDMAAHLGGLGGGCVAGLCLAHPLTRQSASKRWVRNLVLAGATLVAVVVTTRVVPARVDIDAELARLDAAEAAYDHAVSETKAERMSDDEFAQEVESKVLPEWRAAYVRLEGIRGLPEEQARRVAGVLRYAASREQAFHLVVEAARKHDTDIMRRANDKQQEADELLRALK
jgi:rhomboid protease GluP